MCGIPITQKKKKLPAVRNPTAQTHEYIEWARTDYKRAQRVVYPPYTDKYRIMCALVLRFEVMV